LVGGSAGSATNEYGAGSGTAGIATGGRTGFADNSRKAVGAGAASGSTSAISRTSGAFISWGNRSRTGRASGGGAEAGGGPTRMATGGGGAAAVGASTTSRHIGHRTFWPSSSGFTVSTCPLEQEKIMAQPVSTFHSH